MKPRRGDRYYVAPPGLTNKSGVVFPRLASWATVMSPLRGYNSFPFSTRRTGFSFSSLLQHIGRALNRFDDAGGGFARVFRAAVVNGLPQIRKRLRGVASVVAGRVNLMLVPTATAQAARVRQGTLGGHQGIVDALQACAGARLRVVALPTRLLYFDDERLLPRFNFCGLVREIVDGFAQCLGVISGVEFAPRGIALDLRREVA